jgi:hypothetical protein
MRCSGADNEGHGITGSMSNTILNGTSFIRSGITLKNSETSGNILVTLDDPNASINGRSCSLTLIADLWAQDFPGGTCSACIGQPVLEVTRTCGWVGDDDDDCHYFDLFCHFYEGTWPESSFFYIVFNSLIYIFVSIIYMVVLNGKSEKMKALSLEINKSREVSSTRTSKAKATPRKIANSHHIRHRSKGRHEKHKKRDKKKDEDNKIVKSPKDRHHRKKSKNRNKKEERALSINNTNEKSLLLINNKGSEDYQTSSSSSASSYDSDSDSSFYTTSSSDYSSD